MLSLVLPTYNEAGNIAGVVTELEQVLAAIPFEVIVVDDDSPDKTWETAESLAKTNPRVRVIRRVGRRGLSTAVIEGFRAAKGDVFAVADADGQHDYTLIPKLYEAVRRTGGIAIGSRYVAGGSVGAWDERRYFLSRMATKMAIRLCRVNISDPMSGLFAVSKETFASVGTLHARGFKILFDILLRVDPKTPVTEIPFTFGLRRSGESKMSLGVQLQFLFSLWEAFLLRTLYR